jgi:multimeric flavodoxin WrbA
LLKTKTAGTKDDTAHEEKPMKITALVGSPRGMKGATGRLMEIVLEGARKQGAAVEVFTIKGQEVKPCRACDVCHKEGTCPQTDSFAAIKESMDRADGIVLACPNYIFHVTAQLKAFLDRCGGTLHLQAFEGKYGAAVVTAGGGDEEPIADYIQHFLAITGATPVGSIWATMGRIRDGNFPQDIREKAFALGEKLVQAWKGKEKNPRYEEVTRRFNERMRSLMLYRREEWPYEYNYWKKHRGLKD